MADNTSNFSSHSRALADVKIWKKDLNGLEAGDLKTQLLYNVAPMLEAIINASSEEFAEQAEHIGMQAAALEEIIDQEGDFLQPGTAGDFTQTLMLGMAIIEIIESGEVTMQDDLMAKRLKDAMNLYKNNATTLLDTIQEITNDDEDEDEDDSIIHGEDTSSEVLDAGGENSAGGDGRTTTEAGGSGDATGTNSGGSGPGTEAFTDSDDGDSEEDEEDEDEEGDS